MAIGIFLVTILALVGLLGPTLQSVDRIEQTDEVSSVVNTVNAFLQSSPEIQLPNSTKFGAIYNAVASGDFATLFVYRKYLDATSTDIELIIGFDPSETSVNPDAHVAVADFANAAGPIFRVVLSPSSVLEDTDRSSSRDSSGIYTLTKDLATYTEGYFAMEVRIFSEDPPGPSGTFNRNATLQQLNGLEPIFVYNTAVVR